MVAKKVRSKYRVNFGWRAIAVSILTVVGLISLVGFSFVHWTERQILTTDNWVQVVGPLPKNDQVASALSTYSVNQLFTQSDLENRISQALPPRASFLAPTLTDQLQSRLTNRTKQLIQSDKFTSLWTSANKAAHQRLLDSARGQTPQTAQSNARFNLDLSGVKDSVSSFLNQRASNKDPNNTPSKNNVALAVNLKTSLNNVKSYIRTADFLNGTLGVLALVCLVGAMVLSLRRRRLLMTISLIMLVIALLQLIGVKVLRPTILNQIQDYAFRPAVGVVYDTLLSSFKKGATSVFFGSLAIFIIALVYSQKFINRSKYLAQQLKRYKKTGFYKDWLGFRKLVRKYLWQIVVAVLVIGLIIMAFVIASFSWATLIRSILFILLSIELVNLVAARTRTLPMKQ